MIDVADNNAVYYYHFDGLGSVIALSDSSANVVETYSYDVFGETKIKDVNDTVIDESAVSNPYSFTSRRLDPETDNYYYRARFYSPQIGRFLQSDIIGYEDGLNLYTYVRNNPINWMDPFGLCKSAWSGITSEPMLADQLDGDWKRISSVPPRYARGTIIGNATAYAWHGFAGTAYGIMGGLAKSPPDFQHTATIIPSLIATGIESKFNIEFLELSMEHGERAIQNVNNIKANWADIKSDVKSFEREMYNAFTNPHSRFWGGP